MTIKCDVIRLVNRAGAWVRRDYWASQCLYSFIFILYFTFYCILLAEIRRATEKLCADKAVLLLNRISLILIDEWAHLFMNLSF